MGQLEPQFRLRDSQAEAKLAHMVKETERRIGIEDERLDRRIAWRRIVDIH